MFKNILQERVFLTILTLQIIFWSTYIINEYISTEYRKSREAQIRMAVVETTGGPAIPVIAQCCTSRNLSEGIYARRSDIPGGYCYHSDCDVIYTRNLVAEKLYKIDIEKKKK